VGQDSGKSPSKRKVEAPIREGADVERQADSGDTAAAPGEERQPERLRPEREPDTDNDLA
jgi:hypothetical protein